jgi:hypothetical protein
MPRINPARRVYVIELDERARDHAHHKGDHALPPVYVGQTALSARQRFANHRHGNHASHVVHAYGRRVIAASPARFDREEDAEAAEMQVASMLRRQGYCTFGGH